MRDVTVPFSHRMGGKKVQMQMKTNEFSTFVSIDLKACFKVIFWLFLVIYFLIFGAPTWNNC